MDLRVRNHSPKSVAGNRTPKWWDWGKPRSHKEPLVIEKTGGLLPGEKKRVWVLSKINRIEYAIIYRPECNFPRLWKIKLVTLKYRDAWTHLIAPSQKHCVPACVRVCVFSDHQLINSSVLSRLWLTLCRLSSCHPRSLPPTHVIYSEEQPQRLCATVNCQRCNLSPRRANQQPRPPPHRGHRILWPQRLRKPHFHYMKS